MQENATEMLTSSNVMTYAVAADRLFTREMGRIQDVFEPEVVIRYKEFLVEEVIRKPLTYLLDKNGHVHQLIKENRHDGPKISLQYIYYTLCMIRSLLTCSALFSQNCPVCTCSWNIYQREERFSSTKLPWSYPRNSSAKRNQTASHWFR